MNDKKAKSVFLVFLIIFSLMPGCKEPTPKPLIRPVRYIRVFAILPTRVRIFSGVAQASLESKLSFKVPGTILNVNVEIGDFVKTDDTIAQLDQQGYILQVQQVQASLEKAKAQQRKEKASYQRVRQLYENNNASRNELDSARAGFESSQANAEAIQKELEIAKLQLDYTTLKAPADGFIANVPVEENENVRQGQIIAVLAIGDKPKVNVAVPESLIAQIKRADKVTVRFDALPGSQFAAIVTEVGVAVTATATTFLVSARIAEPTDQIRSGMTAEVEFKFETKDKIKRFLLPSIAVGHDRQGSFVFILEPIEKGLAKAHRRQVKIGDLTSQGLEILEGLNDSDLVVTAGVSRIKHGQTVKFDEHGI